MSSINDDTLLETRRAQICKFYNSPAAAERRIYHPQKCGHNSHLFLKIDYQEGLFNSCENEATAARNRIRIEAKSGPTRFCLLYRIFNQKIYIINNVCHNCII